MVDIIIIASKIQNVKIRDHFGVSGFPGFGRSHKNFPVGIHDINICIQVAAYCIKLFLKLCQRHIGTVIVGSKGRGDQVTFPA